MIRYFDFNFAEVCGSPYQTEMSKIGAVIDVTLVQFRSVVPARGGYVDQRLSMGNVLLCSIFALVHCVGFGWWLMEGAFNQVVWLVDYIFVDYTIDNSSSNWW